MSVKYLRVQLSDKEILTQWEMDKKNHRYKKPGAKNPSIEKERLGEKNQEL